MKCESCGGEVDTDMRAHTVLKVGCHPVASYGVGYPCKDCGRVHTGDGRGVVAPWLDDLPVFLKNGRKCIKRDDGKFYDIEEAAA